ncbi:MAG: 8-oxoguanine deaminase [Spirochaetia bacterium]|nr:8-oxoguanine deaminase [Spirochaetia bacterium]
MRSITIVLKDIFRLVTDTTKEALIHQDLFIAGNNVEKIVPTGTLPYPADCRVIDCSKHVVMPGMVNTHHHFYQTLTRNHPEVQNVELFDWLTHLYDVWKYVDEEAIYYSSLLAMSELAKTGCTLTTDHHYLYPRGFKGDLMGIQFEAAKRLGMRFSPTRGSMSLSKKDGGLPPDSVVQTLDEILLDSERVINTYHDPKRGSMSKIVLAPCSPFSVTKELMKETSKLARTHKVAIHTHLAETRDENDFCISMYGKRPLELMQECDMIGSDVFFAHGIHFNDSELDLLAQTHTHIAHCPSSNMRLGSGICRVKEMLERGINVGIAVDGSASNDSSDMLGEVRNALLLQRVEKGANALNVSQALTMATIGGAKLLQFEELGKLEQGWIADIAIYDVHTLGYAGALSDPVAALLFCGYDHQAEYSIINGEVVVDKKEVRGVNQEELISKINSISERLLKKAQRKESL